MDTKTKRALAALTTRFYAEHAASFASTRRTPWPGWERCVRAVGALGGSPLRVLDVGAGPLRLERMLARELNDRELDLHAVDNCPALAGDAPGDTPAVTWHERDVVSALIDDMDPLGGLPAFDAAACFGLMHHVPGAHERARLLRSLVRALRPGGIAVVSLWRFMDNGQLAAQARGSLERARGDEALPAALRSQLDELAGHGDRLLGWQRAPGAWRYCHSFSDADVTALIDATAADAGLAGRFRSDGRDGRMNEYLVLRRHERMPGCRDGSPLPFVTIAGASQAIGGTSW